MRRLLFFVLLFSMVSTVSAVGQSTMTAEAEVISNIQFGTEEQGVQFGTFPFNCEPYVIAADNTFEGCPNERSGTYSRGFINLIFEPEQHFQLTINSPDSLFQVGGSERVYFQLNKFGSGVSDHLNGLVTADIPTATNEPTPITNGDGSDFNFDRESNTFTSPGEDSQNKLQMPADVTEVYVVVGGKIRYSDQYKATGTYEGTITMTAKVLN